MKFGGWNGNWCVWLINRGGVHPPIIELSPRPQLSNIWICDDADDDQIQGYASPEYVVVAASTSKFLWLGWATSPRLSDMAIINWTKPHWWEITKSRLS